MKKFLFTILCSVIPAIVFSGEVDYKIGPLLHEKITPSQTESKTRLFQQYDSSEPTVEGEFEDFIKIIVVMDRHHLSDLSPSIIDELETKVTKLGGYIGDHAFNRVQVFMPVGKIKELGEWEEIKLIKLPTPPGTFGGNVSSEGLAIGNIKKWHDNGITGNGVRIGVLDGGFSGYNSLMGPELPVDTTAVYTSSNSDFYSTVHGTACAEIVHDVAPGANLFLVNAGDMDVDYTTAVNWLKQQDVDIISSSYGLNLLYTCKLMYELLNSSYFSVDYWSFQAEDLSRLEEQINHTVSQTVSSGITWSQAANNNGTQRWKKLFNDTDYDNAHNFSNGSNYNELVLPSYFRYGKDVYVVLFWGENTDFVTYHDYDLKIVNEYGYTVESSIINQSTTPLGMEACKFTPIPGRRYYIKIERYQATIQEIMLLVGVDDFAGLKEYSPEKTVLLGTPCANPDVITVGAVPYYNPYFIEDFSGQGPGENDIFKPDLVAPNRVSTVSYDTSFSGTSAAAPHVAGISALVKQKYPSYSPQYIKRYLESNAIDLGMKGKDNVYGSGLVQLPVVPKPPTLNLPADNANVSGTSIELSWGVSAGATQYWLWVRRSSDNVVITSKNIGNVTSYSLTGLSNNGDNYYWMVSAGNKNGWSGFSTARRFYNGGSVIPKVPPQYLPLDKANVSGISIELSWGVSAGATQYWLWVRRSSDNVVITSKNIGNVTSYSLTGLSNNGDNYYWMVSAGNKNGWSGFSTARRFYNGSSTIAVPVTPILSSPANYATITGNSVNLSWTASSGATQYWLWVRRNNDNVVILSRNLGNVTSYNLTGLLNNGENYYWMVRAGNSSGWSSFSPARRFYNGD